MSETLRDLVVSLSLNSDNFARNIRSVQKQIQEAQSAFKLASAGVQDFEKTAAGLSTKLGTLKRTMSLQKDAVGQYERALQQAILFKTIPPAAGGDQLLFQRPIVKVDFTRQQDVEVFKGDGAVMLQMQFPQGINGNIRLTRPAQTGKIGA